MSGHLPLAVGPLWDLFVFLGAIAFFFGWVSLLLGIKQQTQIRPVVFHDPTDDLESAACVPGRAAAAGLTVSQYVVVTPTDSSYGTLSLALGEGVSATLEFKGELAEINRVTVKGLHPDLVLSRGARAAVDRTGDSIFDEQLKLGVPLWKSQGTLGLRGRRALQDLVALVGAGGSFSLNAGTLSVSVDAEAAPALAFASLPVLVARLGELSQALRPGAFGERWLMDIAQRDPVPGARARAVALLGEVPPSGDARQTVEAALNDASAEVRLQAALALRNALMLNEVEIAPLLEAARQDMKRVLAGLEAAGAEIALVALLSAPEGEIVIGAAEALGRIGSVASVEPLRQVVERGVLNNAEKRAARQAIASIQGRLQGAEAGQITVAASASEAGALAVAAEAGQLSEAHAGQRRSMNSTHQ